MAIADEDKTEIKTLIDEALNPFKELLKPKDKNGENPLPAVNPIPIPSPPKSNEELEKEKEKALQTEKKESLISRLGKALW
jgi:hypothetical protein